MSFRFAVDSIVKQRAYPALASWQARPYTMAWRQFGNHWPFTTPLRVEEYCRQHSISINLNLVDDDFDHAWYPVCLGFFDFDIDYVALLPEKVKSLIKQGRLRVLFMYHEGDNPSRIKSRLDQLFDQAGLGLDCFVFVTANTSGQRFKNFVVFHDFELWYHQRNIEVDPVAIHDRPRRYDFLCLSRVHKSWRSIVMADLKRQGLLDNSVWSYCQRPDSCDYSDSPIQLDSIPQLRYHTQLFLDQAPYFCDDVTDAERNDHSLLPRQFFEDTYCNLVIESQFDVDGSGGVFLTEKTFKPIKHGQMFFIAGAAGSLRTLRDLGYRVFDHALDNSYDAIEDPTLRWLALRDSIQDAKQTGLHQLYQSCRDDIEHNQQLFLQAPRLRLNTLAELLDKS